MSRRRSIVWLTLFALAIAFGLWAPGRAVRRGVVEPDSVRVTVAADGAVRVEAADGTDQLVGHLSATAAEADAALERLRAHLLRLKPSAPTNPIGDSLITLEVHGPGRAPWHWIGWIAQAADAATVRQLRLHVRGDAREPVRLEMRPPRKAQFDVLSWKGGRSFTFRLVRRVPAGANDARTEIEVGLRERGDSDEPRIVREEVLATLEAGPAGLAAWLSEHAGQVSGCDVEVGFESGAWTASASGEELRFSEVVETILTLRAFGLEPLHL